MRFIILIHFLVCDFSDLAVKICTDENARHSLVYLLAGLTQLYSQFFKLDILGTTMLVL